MKKMNSSLMPISLDRWGKVYRPVLYISQIQSIKYSSAHSSRTRTQKSPIQGFGKLLIIIYSENMIWNWFDIPGLCYINFYDNKRKLLYNTIFFLVKCVNIYSFYCHRQNYIHYTYNLHIVYVHVCIYIYREK